MTNYVNLLVRVPERVASGFDALVDARRDTLQPTTRTALIRDALAAYLAANPPASTPARIRGGRHG